MCTCTCRYNTHTGTCTCIHNDVNNYKGSILQFCEDDFVLRSEEQYLQQCEELETGQHDHCSKQYGINIRSAFTQLKYYNFCNGSLLTDVMHDVLEGVLQVEVKLILQYCIHLKRYFRLSFLNDLISNFELGYMESTKRPTPIKKSTLHSSDHSLKQNG